MLVIWLRRGTIWLYLLFADEYGWILLFFSHLFKHTLESELKAGN